MFGNICRCYCCRQITDCRVMTIKVAWLWISNTGNVPCKIHNHAIMLLFSALLLKHMLMHLDANVSSFFCLGVNGLRCLKIQRASESPTKRLVAKFNVVTLFTFTEGIIDSPFQVAELISDSLIDSSPFATEMKSGFTLQVHLKPFYGSCGIQHTSVRFTSANLKVCPIKCRKQKQQQPLSRFQDSRDLLSSEGQFLMQPADVHKIQTIRSI